MEWMPDVRSCWHSTACGPAPLITGVELNMNAPRIKAALKEIEASLPEGNAKVRFDVYGGGVDESFIRGSRPGIAKLGLRLLQAAVGEEIKKSINGAPEVAGPLDEVMHPDSDVKFDWIEVADDLETEPPVRVVTKRFLRRATLFGCVLIVVLLVVFLLWKLR
jgi:hypothetical protein